MTTDGITRFKLRPKQQAFVNNEAMFSFYIGGIGAGKTFAGAVRSIKTIIEHPGSLGLIGAPTFPMLRNTTMRTFFDLCPRGLIKTFNKNENTLYCINGSEVIFASMDDPDKARGLNLSWFWLDEAPLCGYYAWKVLKGRAGRQNPKKYPRMGCATGTPKGKDGYWEDFEHNPQPDHLLFRASTYENAVNLPENYADSLGYVGAFKAQEIEGRFEAFEGLVYEIETQPGANSHILQPRSVTFKLPSGAYLYETDDSGFQKFTPDTLPTDDRRLITLTRMYGGVDWGYTNPAVCLAIGIDADERAYIIDEFYERRASLQRTVLPALIEMGRLYEFETFYCDVAEPQNIVDLKHLIDEEHLASNAKPGDNSILPGIQSVRNFLTQREDGRPGLLVHRSCAKTIEEFGSYQYSSKEAKDRNAKELPLPQNDHAMGAIRYVLFTVFGLNRDGAISVAATHRIERGGPVTAGEAEVIRALQLLLEKQDFDEHTRERSQRLVNSMKYLERMGLLPDEQRRPGDGYW